MTPPSPSTRLLRLLGSVDIATLPGASRIAARPKLLALLGYLCAHADQGPRSRQELMALLWPDSQRPMARNSMRQALHVLRVALGAEVLINSGDAVGLAIDRVNCDVIELDRALRARDDLKAVQVYRGDFLAGLAVPNTPKLSDWIDRARVARRREVSYAAQRLAVAAEHDGDASMALHWARRAAELQQPWERANPPLAELIARAEVAASQHAASASESLPHSALPMPFHSPLPAAAHIVVTPLLVLSAANDSAAVAVGFTAALAREISRRSAAAPSSADVATPSADDGQLPSSTEGATARLVGAIEPVAVGYRVRLQLMSAAQAILWSEVLEFRATEIDDVAIRVADSVFGQSPAAPDRATETARADGTDEAELAVLRGDHFLYRQTPDEMMRAIEWFETATRLDPQRARAWSGIGQVLTMQAIFGTAEAADVLPRAIAALDRAMVLDPRAAASTAMRAMAAFIWDWDAARGAALIRTALALDPADRRSWIVDALYHHAPRGRAQETLAAAAQLVAVAPVDPAALSYASLAVGFFDPPTAREYAEASLHLEPSLPGAHWAMSSATARTGEMDIAIAHADHLVERSGGEAGFRAFRALIGAAAGERSAAEQTLQEMLAAHRLSPTARYYTALLRNAVGDEDGAVWGIAAEVERRNPMVIYIGVDPSLGALRSNQTLMQLRKRIGV